MYHSKVYKILSHLNEFKWKVAIKGVLAGLVSGMLVVVYRLAIGYGSEASVELYAYLKARPLMILPWVLAAAAVSLFIAWLVKLEPMAKGSGIPQVEGLVLYGMKMKYYTVLAVRFLAGFLSSFFGLSLGREGPSIQIGASGSQAVAQKICSGGRLEENYLITGGAAAGLSAAFNAPLSGIIFALEEVHRSFSPLILITATTASLTADVVSKHVFGMNTVLYFVETISLPQSFYIWLVPLGILSGLVGSLLNKALLGFQTLYNRLPAQFRPGIAILIALPFGLFLPQVLGGGHHLIELAETGGIAASALFVFMIGKLLFTCTSFGSGVPGGIFMPILSVGALSGSLFCLITGSFGVPAEYLPDFVVCAMAGALSGSVKAPVTSIVLMMEMTGSLIHILPVAACSFIALLVSDILKVKPIYEELLERMENSEDDIPEDNLVGGMMEIPVELGSVVANKRIGEVEWPQGTLIVGVLRGNRRIVPNGSTMVVPGDYLMILFSECTHKEMHFNIRELCHAK